MGKAFFNFFFKDVPFRTWVSIWRKKKKKKRKKKQHRELSLPKFTAVHLSTQRTRHDDGKIYKIYYAKSNNVFIALNACTLRLCMKMYTRYVASKQYILWATCGWKCTFHVLSTKHYKIWIIFSNFPSIFVKKIDFELTFLAVIPKSTLLPEMSKWWENEIDCASREHDDNTIGFIFNAFHNDYRWLAWFIHSFIHSTLFQTAFIPS